MRVQNNELKAKVVFKRVAQGPNFGFEGSDWTVLDPGGLFNDF